MLPRIGFQVSLAVIGSIHQPSPSSPQSMPSIEELPDTPPPLSPQRPNVDIPTERFTAHRRKPSVVSPIAITASSPAARRMSKRETPQAALKDGEARLQWIARMLERWAGLGTAALIAVIVLYVSGIHLTKLVAASQLRGSWTGRADCVAPALRMPNCIIWR